MAHEATAEFKLALESLRRYPEETAHLLEEVPLGESAALLDPLPASRAVALLERLTPETASALLGVLPDEKAGAILASFDPARAAGILARMDADLRERLLGLLKPAQGAELRALAQYPPESAGANMDPRVMAVQPHTTVSRTLARLRTYRDKRVRRVYVVDAGNRLLGSVRLHDLAVSKPSLRVEELMEPGSAAVADVASRDEVVETLTRTRLPSIPVVDFDGRLLGVIRDDILLAAVRAETSSDMQAMVGASREERALSPVLFAVRKRLPWLEVNLLTAFLAAAVVGLFEGTIARFTALAVLLPVVAGQSGNTGAQALAVTMRGLALREIRTRHWMKVSTKEVRVAFLNSVAVALTTSAAVFVWSRSTGLTLVIGTSMILSMVAAGLSGAAIPLLLTAIRQDPAQSSSIILTTVTDVVGFFSFLGIATLLSGMI